MTLKLNNNEERINNDFFIFKEFIARKASKFERKELKEFKKDSLNSLIVYLNGRYQFFSSARLTTGFLYANFLASHWPPKLAL
jgi:hypothetical protein